MIGLLGRKKGMASIFENGNCIAVTVLEVGPCPVVQVKSPEKDSYQALQLGYEPLREKLVRRPQAGHFDRAGVKPHRIMREFRDFSGEYKAGDILNVDLFKEGDLVQVTGISKGRGFAGVIKRHGFTRPNQSHGTHEAFRGPGSIGNASYPGRVWPGKRMPGRMGCDNKTVKNLRVIKIDVEKRIMVVKGAVPGAAGGLIKIRKADSVAQASLPVDQER